MVDEWVKATTKVTGNSSIFSEKYYIICLKFFSIFLKKLRCFELAVSEATPESMNPSVLDEEEGLPSPPLDDLAFLNPHAMSLELSEVCKSHFSIIKEDEGHLRLLHIPYVPSFCVEQNVAVFVQLTSKLVVQSCHVML